MFSNDSIFLYINDSLVSKGDANFADHTGNANDLYIGWAAQIPFNSYFPGKLDDIRIYNRILTPQEVSALYHENGWPSINGQPFTLSVDSLSSTTICAGDTALATLTGNASYYRVSPYDGVLDLRPGTIRLAPEVSTTYIFKAILYTGDEPCRDSLIKLDTLHITVQDAPQMTTGAIYDCRGTTVSLGGPTSGSAPPFRWQWSPATGLDDPTLENPTLTIDSSRRYRVLITDAKGCSTTVEFPVTLLEPPQVDVFAIVAGDTLRGDTIRYCRDDAGLRMYVERLSGDDSLRYLWLQGEELDRTDSAAVISLATTSQTYVVEARDRADRCPGYDTVVIIPWATPEITAGSDTGICPSQSHRLGASSNESRLVYSWLPVETLDNPALPQPTATPTATTIYTVRVTDTLTGCVAVDSVTITVTDVRLSLVESSIDFGTLDGCITELRNTVVVRNDGTDEATMLSGGSSDGVVQSADQGLRIPPGGSAEVELIFRPSDAGDYTGTIILHFGPCGDSLVLEYTGKRETSNVGVDLSAIDFGRTADCDAVPRDTTIVVTNSGTDDAVIGMPLLPAPYTVVSPALPATVSPGDAITITIGYAPTGAGTFPHAMKLPFQTGTCADSMRVQLRGEVFEPVLMTESTALDFGLLDGCTTDTVLSIELTNPGSDLLSITQVELPTGVIRPGNLDEVPAGGTATLQLRYAPSGTGTLNGEALVIYGPCPDTLRVSLVGEKRGVSFAIADTLDFGEVCLGESGVLPLEVLLNSQGTGNGAVVEAVLADGGFGMDQMDWMDIMDGDGAELGDGVARTFGVTFTPDAEGPVTGTLRLRLEPCGVERTVVLRGTATRVQLSTPGFDFGTLPSGTTTAGTLRYTNTGGSTVLIDQLDEAAMNGSPFTVLSTTPALPVELGAGETIDITVEYTVGTGASTATLGAIVVGACDTTVVATIRGIGESSGFARLKLPQLAGEPGELLQLTMEVVDAAAIPAEGISFRAEVSVEPSILSIADATPWRIANNGQRVIEVVGVIRPNESVAASVPVTALLGRVESSPLALFSIELTDPTQQLALEVEDGSLEILGLCREGGVRLFDPSGEIAIKSIAPSPTLNQMTITYSLSETGEHRMMLVDAGGREVLELFSGMFLPGTFELVRDVTSLPSGAYRLVLETPTLRVSEGVVIGR